jgi:hypothetical protein
MSIDEYREHGWTHVESVVTPEDLTYLKEFTLEAKRRVLENPDFGTPTKPNGSGFWWKGLDMASKSPLNTPEENQKLFSLYTSNFMYEIASSHLETDEIYLLNDQIVVKMPNEDFVFKEHRDNNLFENGEEILLDYDSLNILLILDDFTDENGTLEVQSKLTQEWVAVYPKEGDAILIDGDTLHRSGLNGSEHPRRAYACVYATAPVGKDFRAGWWHERFVSDV